MGLVVVADAAPTSKFKLFHYCKRKHSVVYNCTQPGVECYVRWYDGRCTPGGLGYCVDTAYGYNCSYALDDALGVCSDALGDPLICAVDPNVSGTWRLVCDYCYDG